MLDRKGQAGKEGEQWVRVIDGALQEWEAEHRKHGGDRSNVCDTDDDPRDQESARGIRRRIQKRAVPIQGSGRTAARMHA